MNNYTQLLIICFIIAIIVNYVTHEKKGIKRKKYAVLTVGVISGFASFIISLMLLSSYSVNWLLMGGMVSAVFSYMMADVKGFRFIK